MDLKPLAPLFAFVCVLLSLAACSDSTPAQPLSDKTQPPDLIVVTDAELYCTIKEMAKHMLRVELVAPDESIRHGQSWTPDDDGIALLREARLIFAGPTGSQSWLDVLGVRTDRVYRVGDADHDRLIALESSTHSHGPAGDHSHDVYARSPWYDPALAQRLFDSVLARIGRAWPKKIDSVNLSARLVFAGFEDVATPFAHQRAHVMFASHDDAWRYAARSLGAGFFMIDPDTNPATIRRACVQHGATMLVVIGDNTPAGLESAFDSPDIALITVNDLEGPCGWLNNLRSLGEAVTAAE